MTCKVSFFNSIRETMKHHVASTFASVLIIFIQFLVFFLGIQNSAASIKNYVNYSISEWHQEIIEFLEPNYAYYAAVIIIAIILAFDYFRYLHSKKQMDFYESLPVKRCDWFVQKTASSFLVFLIPYALCTIFECAVLFAHDLREPVFYTTLLWNVICMILIFAVTWITAVLAMVMTGHSVVASFGLAVFCSYAPVILRYIFPLYAEAYFHTYVSSSNVLSKLTYFSPASLAVNLIGNVYQEWSYKEHITDFVILFVMIFLLFAITYILFCKRPTEAAGRAMAFEKYNPVIRILLVIPLSLYLGMYLSLVTNVGTKIWMIIGFVLGVVLLHGIIESIFQFDIRGLWSHKIQMLICLAATITFAFTFWIDLFGYDKYIPEKDSLEVIKLSLNDPYYYRYTDSDGLHDEQLDMAYELIELAVQDDIKHSSNGSKYLRATFVRENGRTSERRYFIDYEKYIDKINALYSTKDFKNDICYLYDLSRDTVSEIEWYDNVTLYPLILTESERDILFDTYLAEFTPCSYSDILENSTYGSIEIMFEGEYGYRESMSCHIFPQFEQTIALLEEYLANNEITKDYGALDSTPLERYRIRSIDIYTDEESVNIDDSETILTLKESLIYADDYYKKYGSHDSTLYFDGTAEVITHDGVSYISVLIPRDSISFF